MALFEEMAHGRVAIPILITLIGFGPRWLFYLLLFVVSCIGLHEFFRLTSPNFLSFPGARLQSLLFVSGTFSRGSFRLPLRFSVSRDDRSGFLSLLGSGAQKRGFRRHGSRGSGFVYAGLPLSLLVLVDRAPRGNV